ncbi:MAG: M20/M25/M40 family metallo-hydrolase [Pyrinomonadaceae bacterium]|nr:M20/M25/M40 family metallo-hydrolase [Pyrinomonadaceae bacterium]
MSRSLQCSSRRGAGSTLGLTVVVLSLVLVLPACDLIRFGGSNLSKQQKDHIRQKVTAATCSDANRLAEAEKLFDSKGLQPELEEYSEAVNVVSKLKGKTSETIVVGAHYDKTTLGCGAIDNWTGVVMLTMLAEELKASSTQKTYLFVAFGGEERDLKGSRAMAYGMVKREEDRPCAMVNLDSFGFEKAWALKSISDDSLLKLASDVERKRGGSFSIRNYRGASSDSKSFQLIGVPSITFSGLGDDWRDYLHQDSDIPENVDFESVFDNYEFLREFLRNLDESSCESLK